MAFLKGMFGPNIQKMKQAQDVAGLIELLASKDDKIRYEAQNALVEIGAAALPVLREALHSPQPEVQDAALRILVIYKDETAVSKLSDILVNRTGYSDKSIGLNAVNRLVEIGGLVALPGLLIAVKDFDSEVRRIAADALIAIGSPAVPGLVEAAQNTRACEEAARALQAIGSPEAILGLSDTLLRHESESVRAIVAKRLGETQSPEAVPALLKALHDSSSKVRDEAAAGLWYIAHPGAVPGLIEALQSLQASAPKYVVVALGKIGDPTAVPALAGALQHYGLRRNAAFALADIGGDEAFSALLNALHDSDGSIRQVAAAALGKCANAAAVPALLGALDDSDAGVRQATTVALGEIGDASAVPRLIQQLGDQNQPAVYIGGEGKRVCDDAANALCKINTPEAWAAVLPWLKVNQPTVWEVVVKQHPQ